MFYFPVTLGLRPIIPAMTRCRSLECVTCLVALVSCATVAHGANRYTFQVLTSQSDWDFTAAGGISHDGTIFGQDGFHSYAFWRGTDIVHTDSAYPYSSSYGWISWLTNKGHALRGSVLWTPDGLIPLESHNPDSSYLLAGLNERDEVVGTEKVSDFLYRAVRWDASHAISNLATPTGRWSIALGISNRGMTVGAFEEVEVVDGQNKPLGYSPVLWTPSGEAIELQGYRGNTTWATSITESNAIYGYCSYTDDNGTGVLENVVWPDPYSSPIPLPMSNNARINRPNSKGQVVGVGEDGNCYLWSPDGTATLLNPLVDGINDWTIYGLTGISDDGQIVGNAQYIGGPYRTQAFVLTPVDEGANAVPEPRALLALTPAFLSLPRQRRHR
jgi:hypothetical protein